MDPNPSAERAYVAMGSNLGDRSAHLAAAVEALRNTSGIQDVVLSPIFETDPVGPPPQGPYLNAVAQLETQLAPRALLDALLRIESLRGRARTGVRDSARTLDLDLLLFSDRIIDEQGLVVPHPRLCERPFVLEPLAALAPDVLHPVVGEPIGTLAGRVRNSAAVRRCR
jgi:2-amino-4-hydroxy-6-hydroxymethyldihydropteridine diphosphokinase